MGDRSHDIPSIFRRLERSFALGGIAQMVRECEAIKTYYPHSKFNEESAHYLGIRFMIHNQAAGIALLEMNAKDYPKSSRAYERLAAAYGADGNTELATQSYQRALALDPKTKAHVRCLRPCADEMDQR